MLIHFAKANRKLLPQWGIKNSTGLSTVPSFSASSRNIALHSILSPTARASNLLIAALPVHTISIFFSKTCPNKDCEISELWKDFDLWFNELCFCQWAVHVPRTPHKQCGARAFTSSDFSADFIRTSAQQQRILLQFLQYTVDWTAASNTLFWGLPDCPLRRLQHVQKVAARVVSESDKSVSTTPIIRDLHWLPVKLWIVFKLLSLIYSCVRGTIPQ